MTDNNGWPERPGVPMEPEKDGWHWLRTPDGEEAPYYWYAAGECERGRWPSRWADVSENEWPPTECTYLFPCPTPSEIAAREAAAWCAGRDAMRSEAAIEVECRIMCDACATAGRGCKVAQRVCSLNLTPPASYAAALEAVRREERDACAKIAESKALPAPWTPQHEGAKQFGSTIAAAIRARGEEGAA